MLRRRSPTPPGWVTVYDLAHDHTRVQQIQKASKETEEYGFPTEPALFGSRRWWRLIEAGEFPSEWLEGEVADVYWASMADWAEFALRTPHGTEYRLTREGYPRRYVVGLGARVRRVQLPWKKPQAANALGTHRDQVLTIMLEDTLRRSSAVAPGPGGMGYEMAGGPGTRVHYFWFPKRAGADRMARQAGDDMRARAWDDVMAGAWAAVSIPATAPDEALSTLDGVRARLNGRYDGYDLVPQPGASAEAHGPQD